MSKQCKLRNFCRDNRVKELENEFEDPGICAIFCFYEDFSTADQIKKAAQLQTFIYEQSQVKWNKYTGAEIVCSGLED